MGPIGTSDATVQAASDWSRGVGKTVVTVGDSTGFVVNRLLVPYMIDAVRLYEHVGFTVALSWTAYRKRLA